MVLAIRIKKATKIMKTITTLVTFRKFFVAALLLAAVTSHAQTYTNVYSFSFSGFDTNDNVDVSTNGDGSGPYGGLVLSSNVLYGTAWESGTNGQGTVFAVNTAGTGFTNLHNFAPLSYYPGGTNFDGAKPHDSLAISGNVLYGTAAQGGGAGWGTVFRLNTDGTCFTNLHNFNTGTDGISPNAGVVVSGNTLYGTAPSGGTEGAGMVFRLNIDGTGYTNLHSFTGATNDGGIPNGGLLLASGTLFGETSGGGGTPGRGVVFALSTNGIGNGSGYKNLHVFTGGSSQPSTNNGGVEPYDCLTLSGDTLYGTTVYGGTNGDGTLFAVQTNGMGFTNLHTFSAITNSAGTNSDGAYPLCTLALSGSTLYGTAASGGTNADGTIFAINTDGTGFRTVYNFIPIYYFNGGTIVFSGGASPQDGVVVSNNILYGTTFFGGNSSGNVFAYNLSSAPPENIPLTFSMSNNIIVLAWSSSVFTLQSATSVTGPFTNVPVVTNLYYVYPTNAQEFFRLQAN
jgi:uncharacterized repeat protein (TIGR03803 family)